MNRNRLFVALMLATMVASACSGSSSTPSSPTLVSSGNPMLQETCAGRINRLQVMGMKPVAGSTLRSGDVVTYSVIGERSKREYGIAVAFVLDDGQTIGSSESTLSSSCSVQWSGTVSLYGSTFEYTKGRRVSVLLLLGDLPLYDKLSRKVIFSNVVAQADLGGNWLVE